MMNLTSEMRKELQSLSIPKDQRPKGAARARTFTFPIGRLLLLALVGGLGYYAYINRGWLKTSVTNATDKITNQSSPEVVTLVVRAQSEQSSPPVLTATGKIVSDHKVSVVTKVSGQIVELRFEQGDRVEKGQVLARIEDVNYRARRDEAAAMVARAEADVRLQEFEYARMNELAEESRASEKEIVAAKSAMEQAKAQLAANNAALVWANKALIDTEVVAPIAGVVLERSVEVGDFVAAEGGRGANANAQFATIADMSKLRVEIDISEQDVARVKKDMPCQIVPDAYKERKYHGRVMWIDPGANYAKATVQSKVRIENPDDALRVEGSAQVQFLSQDPRAAATEVAKPVIWVPASSVKIADTAKDPSAQSAVFRIADGKLVKTPVTIGRRQGGQYEILDGLKDGESIVQKDVDALSDGQRIR